MSKILYYLLLCLPCSLSAQQQLISQLKRDLPGNGNDSLQYTDLLNRISLLYLPRQLDSSYHYAREGHTLAVRQRYPRGIADASMNLGTCFSMFCNNRLTYRFYQDGLQRYRQLGDSAGICKALYSMGIYYYQEGRQSLAEPYMQESMGIGSRLLHDSAWAPMLASYYLVFASDDGKKDSAQWALRKAWEIADRYHDKQALAYTTLFLAKENLHNGDKQAALAELKKIAEDAEQDEMMFPAVYAYAQLDGYATANGMADSTLFRQQLMEAVHKGGYTQLLAKQAMWLYRQKRDQHTVPALPYADMLEGIANRQKESGTWQSGDTYMEDLLQEEELKSRRLAKELEEESELRQSLEIRNRNMLITFLAVCTILLTGLIVTSYRMQGFRRRSKRSMGEINRFIRDKNRQLQHHDDFKNKLLSILAHDFRMPLGHIINASMLFDKDGIRPEEMREISGSIASMATETLQLFENVLRWIKSQLAGFEYKPQPYSLQELWTEVQEPLADSIRDKSLLLETHIPEGMTVMADKEMLQFVNRNLLHNAVKFSRRGNRIIINCTMDDGRVCVTVTNEGIGIKAIDIPFVFEYKVVGKYARETGRGAGIALIICKDFIERMGGVITVRSDGSSYTSFEYML